MDSTRRIGVILAAGRGRRMGGTKQLAVWKSDQGTKPLVAAAYDAIRAICAEFIVVVGHEPTAVAAALDRRPFHAVHSNPDAPMFESIRSALLAAKSLDPYATVVLQPGDHPEVAPTTLTALTACSLQRSGLAIIPQCGASGGHPVLIPPPIAALILDADCPAGLGEFWIKHPELCHRVPVDDPSVLRGIDTPSDLRDSK